MSSISDFGAPKTMSNSLYDISAGVFYDACMWIRSFPDEVEERFPNMLETILHAPPGFVGVYVDAFTKGNLRLPLNPFMCDVLVHFGIHFTRLNPEGWFKLTNFIVICKAYNCEVSVDLFKCFFQACYVGDWVTFRRRGNKKSVFTEPMKVIKNWHSRFIFVSNNVIPVHYQPLVFAGYLHASHAFPNDFPVHLENDPDYQRLCRYPAKRLHSKTSCMHDGTEAYYTGTEALVNDVGSPSHLKVFPLFDICDLSSCSLVNHQANSLEELTTESGETFFEGLLTNGKLLELVRMRGEVEEVIAKWTFHLILYSSKEVLQSAAVKFWCSILLLKKEGDSSPLEINWLPSYSELSDAFDTYGFLLHSPVKASSEMISLDSEPVGPSQNIRAWIKFVIACSTTRLGYTKPKSRSKAAGPTLSPNNNKNTGPIIIIITT
ncbi:hypothetical protein Tco_0870334 [Tanacetum coccineum]